MPEPYLDLEQLLSPLAEPLPASRPGDWLAEHPETGQTFAEYLNARPVRRSDKLCTTYLCFAGADAHGRAAGQQDLLQGQRAVVVVGQVGADPRAVRGLEQLFAVVSPAVNLYVPWEDLGEVLQQRRAVAAPGLTQQVLPAPRREKPCRAEVDTTGLLQAPRA